MSRQSEQIKEALDLRETMEYYGVNFNRRGYAICPFHSEKTASLSVKNGQFTCFGCGARGDVIDFVKMYFGISFAQSLIRLNNDFGLRILSDKLSLESLEKQKKMAEARKKEKEKRVLSRCFYHMVINHYRFLFLSGASEKELKKVEFWLDENIEMGVSR